MVPIPAAMDSELTLKMDDSLVQQAKYQAARRGKSVSRIFGEFVHSLSENAHRKQELPPITASLLGIIAGAPETSDQRLQGASSGEIPLRVLVDTNVVLDVLLDRAPFSSSAARIFALAEQSGMEGFLCATTVTTIDYFLEVSEKILNKPVPAQGTPRLDPGAKRQYVRRCIPASDARKALKKLLQLFASEASPQTEKA